MLKLEIEITGNTTSDLEIALDEVRKQVSEGFTKGFNRNDTGRYHFDVTGEEEETEEEE